MPLPQGEECEPETDQRQYDAGVFADQRRGQRKRGEPIPTGAVGGPDEPEREPRIKRDLVKFRKAHRQERRIDEREKGDAHRVAFGEVIARHRIERKDARADQRRLGELKHERRSRDCDQRPEQRHDRRPVEAEVCALFGTVVKAAERVADDLRERPGIGAVGPEMPAVRRRRAEPGNVDGVPEGDASQVVAGTA